MTMTIFCNRYRKGDSGTLEIYELCERIGQGSYGTVHRAINRVTGVTVAIKRPLFSHGDTLKRFRNEIDFYSRLQNSPFVVKMLDFSLNPSGAFVAIEFCNKGTVRDNMWELQINRLLTIGLLWQTTCALADLHHLGILHRDIKPENLLLIVDASNNWSIKIGDPGLVCFPARSVFDFGVTRTAKGTEFYIAPELYQPFAVYSASCDIFSLGVTAHEMLTGQRAIGGSRVTGLGEKLDNLLSKMISLDPSVRPTALGVRNEVNTIYNDELVAARKRNEVIVLAGIALAAIGIGHLLATAE